jgi:hypothetical protein
MELDMNALLSKEEVDDRGCVGDGREPVRKDWESARDCDLERSEDLEHSDCLHIWTDSPSLLTTLTEPKKLSKKSL